MSYCSTSGNIKDRAKRSCHSLSVSYCKWEGAGVSGKRAFLIQQCSETDTGDRQALARNGRNLDCVHESWTNLAVWFNSPLKKSLCRRGRAIVAEDKARNRVPSCDSARARNAVFRPQGPAVARMGFFNGLLIRSSRRGLS